MLLYSDNIEKNASHTHAVPLMLSKDPHNAPIGWEYHGSWNIKSSSETKKKNDIKSINMDNKILEIKALKRAWEEMEPGRAMRAEISRARYLEE
ncbi:unnamed protein product [Schistosoma margrebowiei]|uniref:Uncharacterized protein n=1 Tax=Schistosoma margrebowiei TaxID=48269 RepID=A0A183N4S3_9TREM|nr:unnamed protein product [Schistosoma margrebowiei]